MALWPWNKYKVTETSESGVTGWSSKNTDITQFHNDLIYSVQENRNTQIWAMTGQIF